MDVGDLQTGTREASIGGIGLPVNATANVDLDIKLGLDNRRVLSCIGTKWSGPWMSLQGRDTWMSTSR